jgi:hypothetical protein
MGAEQIVTAHKLRAVIELYGAFPDTVDYAACFAHGIEVLSTGPRKWSIMTAPRSARIFSSV